MPLFDNQSDIRSHKEWSTLCCFPVELLRCLLEWLARTSLLSSASIVCFTHGSGMSVFLHVLGHVARAYELLEIAGPLTSGRWTGCEGSVLKPLLLRLSRREIGRAHV